MEGCYLAVQGRITVGNIQSFIQYNKQFTQPINQIAQISSMLQFVPINTCPVSSQQQKAQSHSFDSHPFDIYKHC